jgi:hypothetical protein
MSLEGRIGNIFRTQRREWLDAAVPRHFIEWHFFWLLSEIFIHILALSN